MLWDSSQLRTNFIYRDRLHWFYKNNNNLNNKRVNLTRFFQADLSD